MRCWWRKTEEARCPPSHFLPSVIFHGAGSLEEGGPLLAARRELERGRVDLHQIAEAQAERQHRLVALLAFHLTAAAQDGEQRISGRGGPASFVGQPEGAEVVLTFKRLRLHRHLPPPRVSRLGIRESVNPEGICRVRT